jgi:hypothetical protein
MIHRVLSASAREVGSQGQSALGKAPTASQLTIERAECDAMTSHHVKMHAVGVHRVAADRARHAAGRFGNRLFQQGLRSLLLSTSGSWYDLLTLRPLSTPRTYS